MPRRRSAALFLCHSICARHERVIQQSKLAGNPVLPNRRAFCRITKSRWANGHNFPCLMQWRGKTPLPERAKYEILSARQILSSLPRLPADFVSLRQNRETSETSSSAKRVSYSGPAWFGTARRTVEQRRAYRRTVRLSFSNYALVSSLSRATRSCGSFTLLMRYSGSLLPGSCLITSKTPPGAFRLIARLIATISPTLNLWDDIGSSPLPPRLAESPAKIIVLPNAPERV
jgi:hypothetical protein